MRIKIYEKRGKEKIAPLLYCCNIRCVEEEEKEEVARLW